jgi:hypothetical protein
MASAVVTAWMSSQPSRLERQQEAVFEHQIKQSPIGAEAFSASVNAQVNFAAARA